MSDLTDSQCDDMTDETLALCEAECMSIGGERGGRLRAALFELRRHRLAADRAVTIADEAFGLGPVEPLDDTLGRIERGINQQHQRIVQLESALAADRERVRSVVRDCVWATDGAFDRAAIADAIATRAAEQLATASEKLSIPERVELDCLLEHLVEQRTEATNDGRSGDAEAFNDWHTVLAKLLGASK